LFEKEAKIGRKLSATGNGRCNISNNNLGISYYNYNAEFFLKIVFDKFGYDETEKFFFDIGVPFIIEEDKTFPASLQASSVIQIFRYELKKRGVNLLLNEKVKSIKNTGSKFLITSTSQESEFDAVILSAGSAAYPSLGGCKFGYEIASSLGHKISKLRPVIQPVNIPLKSLHKLEGIKRDVSIMVEINGKVTGNFFGEILFTAYGISGPVSLNASGLINKAISEGQSITIVLDLFPQMDETSLFKLLNAIWQDEDKKISFSLTGILKERMPEFICNYIDIDAQRKVKTLNAQERKKLVKTLKELRLTPGKSRDYADAVAVNGGVLLDEIDSQTMESKIVKNLFITGELLDVDGISGGYNLQFAWSSGAIAGMSVLGISALNLKT
jgi:predicted Rossmann fold flavoprotein